ncbi:MAG: hypothetical protein H6739_04150 [Alphaproteobacteria bacterium]|nr:hypothetical protein [Alphaproteobacteria bacterium]
MAPSTADVKQRLYQAATRPEHRAELTLAASQWFEGEPDPSEWLDFLDFFALEWVDAQGFTLLERELGDPLDPALLRWLLEVRSGVFVIDGEDGGVTRARDAATEQPLALLLPEPQPRRSVLVGRLLPAEDGRWRPSGQPDLYDPMSMLSRLGVLQAWQEGHRRALVERLAELRAAFIRQREQQRAFVVYFGTDMLLFDDGEALAEAFRPFMVHLLFEHRPPSQGGRTLAELRAEVEGLEVPSIDVRLGETLEGGHSVGVIFDRLEGLHFLPGLLEFMSYMKGESNDADIIGLYANDPGVTALPFRRAGQAQRLAAALGVPVAPLDELIQRIKPPRRLSPSLMPGFEVAGGAY